MLAVIGLVRNSKEILHPPPISISMAAVVVADAAAVVAVEAISITMVLDAAMLIVVLPISILMNASKPIECFKMLDWRGGRKQNVSPVSGKALDFVVWAPGLVHEVVALGEPV